MGSSRCFLALFLVAGSAVAAFAQANDPILQPEVTIAGLNVGGLTTTEARYQLRLWWDNERRTLFSLTNSQLKKQPEARSLTSWGVALDDAATLAAMPKEAFYSETVPTGPPTKRDFDAVYKFDAAKMDSLQRFIEAQLGTGGGDAQVAIVGGKVVVKGAKPAPKFDRKKTLDNLMAAWRNGDAQAQIDIDVPASSIPEGGLALVEISRFSTRYPTGQKSRNNNLSLASGKIDGHVLMPGEVFSFNGTVGKRTVQAGFKEAGVYVNGRHDTGVGGGICQVSTTLYNASLLADLGIVQRRNHSMPVAYVPVGRDATVSWGSLDLKLKNPYDFPIAFRRTFGKGSLTFIIYGQPTNKTVKITSGKRSSWAAGSKTVFDSSLRPGSRRVVEKGSAGHRVTTYRQVFSGGKLVRTDNLGLSYYPGGPRIIAVGPKPRSAPRPATMPLAAPMSAPTPPAVIPQRRGG